MTYIPNTGVVSTANSSTSAILGGDTFTGTAEDISQYSMITVFLDPDVSGTLRMEFSINGTDWDRAKVVSIPQGGGAAPHTLGIVSQYFRVVYINGVLDQTKFNLQTIYHHSKSKHLTSSPNEVIGDQNDVELMRIFNDVKLDRTRGAYRDQFSVHKFGANDSVSNSNFDHIWSEGGNYPYQQSASILSVSSNNANDSDTLDGARSVVIEGLDSNFDELSETLLLSGTTVNTTTNSFIRVNRAYVSGVGLYDGSNIGVIKGGVGGDVQFALAAGLGQTQIAHYCVPNNHTAYLTRIEINVDGSKSAEVRLMQRPRADDVSAPFGPARLVSRWVGVIGERTLIFDSYAAFSEKTDLFVVAQGSDVGGTEIEANFDLIVVENSPGGLVEPQ